MFLTYGEVEDFLAEIHGVAPEKRVALKGRLKHFQRLSWPAGTNQGKGARVQYGIGQTMSLALGMELLQLGLTPERVVEQLRPSNTFLAQGFLAAFYEYGAETRAIYYIFSPENLSVLQDPDEHKARGHAIFMAHDYEIPELLNTGVLSNAPRFAFINITRILFSYIDYFLEKGLGAPSNLEEPLQNWITRAVKEQEDYYAHVIEGMPYGDS